MSNIKLSSIFSVFVTPICSSDFNFLRVYGDYLCASYLSIKGRLFKELGNNGLEELTVTGYLIASITLCNLLWIESLRISKI